jgi:uncharacterized protein YjbI with pentapeptide repeats
MILKTLLTALSFIFVFSQPVFAVENEDAKIAQNILKLKATTSCEECNLSGANLSGENLRGANLRKANLTEANLTKANLSRADLFRARLSRADLSGADLSGADLKRAKLRGVIFCNTKTPWGLDNSGCKK